MVAALSHPAKAVTTRRNPLRSFTSPAVWVVSVMVVGSVFRLFQLGGSDLWLDEASIWSIGRGSLEDVWRQNALLNSAPPVYPLLIKLVGAGWGNSEAQLRSISVIAGVLTLPALFSVARRWLDIPTACLAVALMAFAPWQIFYARELREYAPATLAALLVWLTLERLLEAPANRGRVAVYALVASIGLTLQFGMIVIVACSQAIYLVEVVRRRQAREQAAFAVCSGCLALVVGGAYVSLRAMLVDRSISFAYLDAFYLSNPSLSGIAAHLWTNSMGLFEFADISRDSLTFMPLFHLVSDWHWLIFGLGVLGGTLVLWRSGNGGRRAALWVVLPVSVIVVLSCLRLYPFGLVRQDIIITPGLYVAAAAGIMAGLRRLTRVRWLSSAIAVAFVLPLFPADLRNFSPGVKGEPLQPALVIWRITSRPGRCVCLLRGGTGLSLLLGRPRFEPAGRAPGVGNRRPDRPRRLRGRCPALLPVRPASAGWSSRTSTTTTSARRASSCKRSARTRSRQLASSLRLRWTPARWPTLCCIGLSANRSPRDVRRRADSPDLRYGLKVAAWATIVLAARWAIGARVMAE